MACGMRGSMPCRMCRAVCIALAVGLWAAWLAALGASLFFAFYAMSLAGLSLPVAAAVVLVGALAGVRVMAQGFKLAVSAIEEKCVVDEALSKALGVKVYRCPWRDLFGVSLGWPFTSIAVGYPRGFTEEEVKASLLHELSHVKRRDFFLATPLKTAIKAALIALFFQLALAAGVGGASYGATLAFALVVAEREICRDCGGYLAKYVGLPFLALFMLLGLAGWYDKEALPVPPPPQLGLWDAAAATLALASSYLTWRLSRLISELLADVEAAAAVGEAMATALKKAEEYKRGFEELNKMVGITRGLVDKLLALLYAVHPPYSLRIKLLRLCAK